MKYFGTDGIRGEYNKKLTVDLSLKIGKAAGTVFYRNKLTKIVIGKDPRISSDPLAMALISGLLSTGVDVLDLEVVTTPIISYSIVHSDNDAGVMISASHNPFMDNGIKFFGSNGHKLSDELELAFEECLNNNSYQEVHSELLGKYTADDKLKKDYQNFIKEIVGDLSGYTVVLDMANGSSAYVAEQIFQQVGAKLVTIGNEPNGVNINDQVGSTHPEKLIELIEHSDDQKLIGGFAYDGDGDRVMMVDKKGKLLDGDYILYILAKYFKMKNILHNDVIITTVMANLGLLEVLNNENIKYDLTQVGDRFVMQEISKTGASIGGEQSGHIILPEYLPTGDGILVSAFLLKIIKEVNVEEYIAELKKFPQTLVNVKVADKHQALADKIFQEEIKKVEKKLQNSGRVLIRTSGTEELVRIMIEAKTEEESHEYANYLKKFVK